MVMLFIFSLSAVLLMGGEVECFTPLVITSRVNRCHRVESELSSSPNKLPDKKENKFSKEAAALLHVLEHGKEEGYDVRIAQTAPSVR